MDVREKLVEILKQAPFEGKVLDEWWWEEKIKRIADHLIMNGVTVQEWIPVAERLPTIYDADADNCVLAIHKASNKRYYHWRSVANNPFDFTHWMKTPPTAERRIIVELKSCPLCGGKIDERGWQCNYGDRIMTLNLKCEKCGTIFKFKSNWLVDPYSEAIEAWNRRANDGKTD